MESRPFRIALVVIVGAVLLFGAFSGGVIVGWAMPIQGKLPITLKSPFAQSTPGANSGAAVSTDTLFKPFWQAWNLVHEEYVDQPVDDTAMMRGAIRGMLDSLGDQHTSYMDPVQFSEQSAPLQGEYEGIGAWVDTTTEYLTIINPMPGSPAEKQGLKTGDQIVAVDGQDMTGIGGELVLRKILGPAGTKVTLSILRKGEEKPFDVVVERAVIKVPSVETKMLDNNIAYVKLNTFGEKTSSELKDALKDVMAKNPKGMIFDLRNNGGGYLTTAIDVVSQFIPKGVVMYEEYGDKTRHTYNAKPGGLATEIPLVVLVNQGTASASEITAGAIQDYGRGKLVGVKTYGKGSVQNWVELDDNQGAVRVTVARWLTPKERQIHKIGLIPDVVVEITEADITANHDSQLEKAIELLK